MDQVCDYEAVARQLRAAGGRLYGVFDAARDDRVLPLLRTCHLRPESLFSGRSAVELAAVAPYLVALPSTPHDATLITLLEAGWGNSWGIYLASDHDITAVRRHLRTLLMVGLSGAGQAYFRFYDPRVFRSIVPELDALQRRDVFSGVRCYLVEDEIGKEVVAWPS